jgi:hypothetical protein
MTNFAPTSFIFYLSSILATSKSTLGQKSTLIFLEKVITFLLDSERLVVVADIFDEREKLKFELFVNFWFVHEQKISN